MLSGKILNYVCDILTMLKKFIRISRILPKLLAVDDFKRISYWFISSVFWITFEVSML